MGKTRIAPMVAQAVEAALEHPNRGEQSRRELRAEWRALLAVARAARRVILETQEWTAPDRALERACYRLDRAGGVGKEKP